MMKNLTLACAFSVAVLCGCRDAERTPEARPAQAAGHAVAVPLAHAVVFALDDRGDTTIVTVRKPWQGAQADFTYILTPRNGTASDSVPGALPAWASGPNTSIVPVPVRRAITMTTTNLRDLESIGALDALVGLGGSRYVCSPEIRARLGSGRIRDVGSDMNLDVEAVVSLKPDLLFTYVVGKASDGGLAKLAETGVPVAIEGSYMEESPLGRAEWIKFTAAFFGRRAAADSAFAKVDSAYRALAALARTAKRRPTVVVGAPFGGAWWMASGRTYVGRILADAGGDFLWASDTTRGSLNLDMEAVLGRASEAEFWINAGDWKDLADAKRKDPRNALFKAWKDGRVYVNDAIRCEEGGRDFYESGAARPDWILADLIAILHPELLPDHKLRWYRRLPGGA
jgi:iron complex transport system substrate-binding protein